MTSDNNEADFLRRLSIADAKVLLERTKKEKENKTKEMQKMIGVRYRDLIESADKIVNMHSAALRLEVSLKEMPNMWKVMDLALTKALTVEDRPISCKENKTVISSETCENEVSGDALVADKVAFLVEVPEKMWQLLDKGESLQALVLYQQAIDIYDIEAVRDIEGELPFLQAQWACIQSFKARLLSCAKSYLTCRGKESQFYADNLCTCVVLSDSPINAEKLFEMYLKSRQKWMTPLQNGDADEKIFPETSAKKIRALKTMLISISMTMTQTEEIFGSGRQRGLLRTMSQLSSDFKEELEQFSRSGELLNLISVWFQRNRQKILEVALPIIASINSISLLSQVQLKLNTVNAECPNVSLWNQVLSTAHYGDKIQATDHSTSVFSVLFAEAFRKQTRNLLQNSFVEALEAIKCQIRASLDETVASMSRSECRLRNVKFYDFFESIHKKAADLDASELQIVLIEEFLRTFFKLVIFFEQEYPLVENQKTNAATGANIQHPSVFLSISNILAGVVAGFQCQISKLFPGSSNDVTIPEKDPSLSEVGSAIEKYSHNSFVMKEHFEDLLEEILGAKKELKSFIDEELNRVDAVGFFSIYLYSEIKLSVSHPQLFVNVLHGLSKQYCQAWASILVKQKVEPLRELMLMEQYSLTNEEWIATHEGWIEQVIANEIVDEDTEDSSSEVDLTSCDEKVWLPWCETPTVSSFLFSCCYSLDDAYHMVQNCAEANREQINLMQRNIREVLVEQVTIDSVAVYDAAVSLLVTARATQNTSVLNFGECCIQQFLFDMYFVRATLGFSDFIRFGWGDELNLEDCSPGLMKLTALFERMREFIDPVDWEIYGPQLIENVVLQFRKSRLLFSSLSESNDINKINGKEIVIGAQDTRPLARIAEPVARFSLLPVPSSRRRFHRAVSSTSCSSDNDSTDKKIRESSFSLFHERIEADKSSQSSATKLQNLLSSSASSNLFSAATSGTNLLSSAAKGIGYISSATTNRYL